MRLGVIADIHGNLPALDCALDKLETEHDVSAIVCLGDIVGILGWPHECVQRVCDTCRVTVLGNHDRGVLPQMDVKKALENGVTELEYGFVTEQLHTEDAEWLWTLPETARVPEDTPRVEQALLVHSHPDPEIRWSSDDYVTMEMFSEMGSYTEGGTLLLGHLHTQYALNLDNVEGRDGLVLNPGSVGQPHDGQAEYAIVDTASQSYSLHSTEFPTDRVGERLQDLGLRSFL